MGTVRLDPELNQRLEQLAQATERSKSFLAARAIREVVDLNEWQVEEVRNAVAEADRGDFAGEDEILSLSANAERHPHTA